MKQQILKIINENPNAKFNDFSEFRQDLLILKKELQLNSIPEVIYVYFLENEVQKCAVCENDAKFESIQTGYKRTCSRACTYKDSKYKETLSNSVKCSEKAQKQRKERAKLGAYALKESLENRTEKEINRLYNSQQQKREETLIEKYGVNNPMKIKEVAELNHKNMRQTNIDSGRWLNYVIIEDDYDQYCKKVQYITDKTQWKILENSDKRGHISKEGSYHLDHMYSKKQGFIDNIPPHIIGSIHNLEMIKGRHNLSKQEKCSITKDDLFKKFFGDS